MNNYSRYNVTWSAFSLKTKIIIINTGIFLLSLLFQNFIGMFMMWSPFCDNFMPFQLVTHQYLHASISHIFFNMLALYFLWDIVEKNMGNAKKMLIFYTLCGVGASIISSITTHILTPEFDMVPSLGASGSIFGLLGANYVYNKEAKLYIYFIIPVKMKYIFPILMGIELLGGILNTSDGVGHFAHFGGGLCGLLLSRYIKK